MRIFKEIRERFWYGLTVFVIRLYYRAVKSHVYKTKEHCKKSICINSYRNFNPFNSKTKWYIAVEFDGVLAKKRTCYNETVLNQSAILNNIVKLCRYVDSLEAIGVLPVIILYTSMDEEELKLVKQWCESRLPKRIWPTYYNENPDYPSTGKVYADEYWDSKARSIH